jgi:putative ABC transport system permease protein
MRIADTIHLLGEGVVIALESIRANKVRAGLTILGVAVGVFVVTAMSAAIHGINSGVTKSIAAAGPTTFFVTKWPLAINSCNGSQDSCPWRRNEPLTNREAELLRGLDPISSVTSHVSSSVSLKYHERNLTGIGMDGYTPGWLDVTAGSVIAGRDFTGGENESAAPVVILNDKAAERLFPGTDPLDKNININGKPFRVIGVFQAMGSVFDAGSKGRVILPFETARRRLNVGVDWLDMTVQPKLGVPQEIAIDAVTAALRVERGLRPATENTFFVSTQEKILELYNSIVGAFFVVMMVLGSIGLMVGGVGVVAIMMISVTERTREIGVRKALGATKGTIMWQFLVEASTLTTIGAIAGLLVGGGITWLIRTKTPIDAVIPPFAIFAALAASAFTGILFGLLPAARAARLDPVEALRYE